MKRAAAVLAVAGVAMMVAAFAGLGGDEETRPGGARTVASDAGATVDGGSAGRPSGQTPAIPGLRVWTAQGCGSCHTLAAAGAAATVGPDLGETLKGRSPTYVLESIVAPDEQVAAGYGGGTMPDDYAQRVSAEELDDLVEFLRTSAR